MNTKINFASTSPAVITAEKSISYFELGARIASFSDFLQSKGIKEGDYTGILLNNSADFITVLFALWKLKSVPVLLNTRLTSKEIEVILSRSRVTKVITNNKYEDKLSPEYLSINIQNEDIKVSNETSEAVSINSVVIFTSGSSGFPKGVVLNSDALTNSISSGNTVLNQNKNDRWLASLPFYHIGGLMICLRAFSFGASVILPETLKLEAIKKSLENAKPTLASLVPTQLQRLIDNKVSPNPELRNVLLGGSSVEQALVKDALNKGWSISVVYGSTETSSFVAYMPPDELKKNPGSSGKVISPNKIEIIDSGIIEGDPSGEIVIDSPSLFEKYLNDPEETERKLVNGKFFTGDYGFLDQENYLYVLSRRTDMIVSGGENIDPAEVEKHIMNYPGIKDVCVFGRKNDEWGEVVNAVVVSENIFFEDALTEYLKKELASYKIPKQYFRITEIPKTSLGKIRREKVRMMFNKT